MAGYVGRGSSNWRGRSKTGGGTQKTRPELFYGLFQVVEYGREGGGQFMEGRGAYDPEKDYVLVALTSDLTETTADGEIITHRAEFDDAGVPLTQMKLFTPVELNIDGFKEKSSDKRRGVDRLNMKVSGGDPMRPGALFYAEKFVVQNGTIRALFLKGGPTDQQQQDGTAFAEPSKWVTVLPETLRKSADGKSLVPLDKPTQAVHSLSIDEGVVVGSVSELTARVKDILENTQVIGNPGVFVAARKLAPANASEDEKALLAADPTSRICGSVIAKKKPIYDNPEKKGRPSGWEDKTVDEVMADLWAGSAGNPEYRVPSLRSLVGNPEWQIEVIPMNHVKMGKNEVASALFGKKGITDHSIQYNLHAPVDEAGTIAVVDSGWRLSNIGYQRMDGETGVWFSPYQRPVSNKTPTFAQADIPTANMPDYHVTAAFNEATRFAQSAQAFYAAQKKEIEAAAAPAAPAPGAA